MPTSARKLSVWGGPVVRGSLLIVILMTLMAAMPSATNAHPSDSEGETGSLEGTVTLGPELNSRKIRFSLYPDVRPPSAAAPGREASEAANVVVFLETAGPIATSAATRPTSRTMEQISQSFVPHVLPILKGTTVEFPNGDPIYHNVFSLSKAASFDLGRYPRGNSRVMRFEKPGMVKVFCHIHPDMSAIILVLDNSFFTVPEAGGHYEIRGIPPGEYTVHAWHERARPIHRKVTIEARRATPLHFAIPLRDEPAEE
jgi:plastocyanin